jgi:hypothetical protein
MTWAAVGVSAVGAIGGYESAQSGQNAATNAANQNLQLQQKMYEQQDPFSAGGNRAQYVPKLNELAMGGPSSIANDPTYQAMNDKSNIDMNRQLEASGQGGSGQAMLALNQNSQGNQMAYWQQMMSTYAGLSGANSGRTAPMQGESPGLAGQMAGQTASNRMGSFGMFAEGLSSIFGAGKGSTDNSGNNTNSPDFNMANTGTY